VRDSTKVGPGPFVANEAFGDIWVGTFAGADVWRLHAAS
jgi:hypothetical protein